LAAALDLEGVAGATVFAGGTDGTDGPTDAAGGVVDGDSAARMRRANFDPRAALEANDANRALSAAGDVVATGPTCTNLLDLYLVLVR